ncbi:MAG: NAD-dependent dehydratase [Candidatus Yanofskybacteria bacterium CG10_big_fil_rev_8_21_14_0_10_37_15]|uniref:NAD-dependent dehydratase n=1 Tax=Candidatus Yanofskybacteria bacterium CG10_big_fil_rev_8_21_14_0_10_37_15 TaxID=1975097 RepID=A0A2H0R728_9BACT|nr:MAG: NAD-dependent dehydratase [Candidatus Yanofskybacteria bacterium CG10_big_fil_rev_8_21_14_0_10_37_15]
MPKKKIKVIVTGGAGFIGSNLVDTLIENGFLVHVIDNLSGGKIENINKKAKFHHLDITDIKKIQPIFRGAEYVFHLAALPRVQFSIEHPLETDAVNVRGTLNVLEASTKAGIKRLIYSASSSAYGDQKKMPLKEDFLADPKSPYGLQKYIGELYCKMWSQIYHLPTVSLRYFNVYGLRQNDEGAYALVIAKFIKQKLSGQPMTITGDGKQTRDFTNVKDVVRANILAMRSGKVGKGEVINIGAGDNQSINQIAKIIGGPVRFVPARFEPYDTLADNSLAHKLLGWRPEVSIENGIAELKTIYKI